MGYSIVRVEDLEGEGPGGAVRFVRRHLGCEAFGINWFELPPNAEGKEHDETGSGQEEVNVIVRGSGTYRIDDEEVPIEVDTFLRFDPENDKGLARFMANYLEETYSELAAKFAYRPAGSIPRSASATTCSTDTWAMLGSCGGLRCLSRRATSLNSVRTGPGQSVFT